MNMKKEVIVFGMLILCLGFISAASCKIMTKTDCLDYGNPVFGVSSIGNAHGEVLSQNNYDNVLCCDLEDVLGTRTDCSIYEHPFYKDEGLTPSNKIIGLSSLTNAHAEETNGLEYDIPICYEDLICIDTTEDCKDPYPLEIFSLSEGVNAHIGEADEYGTKICCEQVLCNDEVEVCGDYETLEACDSNPCGDVVAKASLPSPDNVGEEEFDRTYCDKEGISCFCEWDETAGDCDEGECCLANLQVKQDYCGNDKIDAGEECDGTDIKDTCSTAGSCTGGGPLNCYPAGHEKECTLDITDCTGCVIGGFCGDGTINNEYETCEKNNLNSKDCTNFGFKVGVGVLDCYSETHTKSCTFDTSKCVALDDHPSIIGNCRYEEITTDTCEDDDFLDYTLKGSVIWDEDNIFSTDPGQPDYIEGTDEKWHYDPDNLFGRCGTHTETRPCPAQIKLPFFGPYSILITITLIICIYAVMIFNEKKTDSKRKAKKK
jgi:hypothetical protein